MKTKILFFLGLFAFITILTSCEKEFDKDEYYKEAKRKHRFFRCKVNGKEWHNAGYGFYGDHSAMEYYLAPDSIDRSGRFIIKMQNRPSENKYEYIYTYIARGLKEGENYINNRKFNKYTGKYFFSRAFEKHNPIYKIYYLDSSYYNNLFISDIDSTNRIITGQFEFRAVTEDKLDTVLVTDGEFDWKPYWYRWR